MRPPRREERLGLTERKQFRDDVGVNPNDTEEAIWAYLSEAQFLGPAAARAKLVEVTGERRPFMRDAYRAFASSDEPRLATSTGGGAPGQDTFYNELYTSLWWEAEGDAREAKRHMLLCARTAYFAKSGDYMATVAAVHLLQRGWDDDAQLARLLN